MTAVQRYRNKITGPILDRIDIKVNVPNADSSVFVKNTTTSTREHDSAKTQIANAIHAQRTRQSTYNSRLSSLQALSLPISTGAKLFLDEESKKRALSARSYFKAIKLAQTICDLDGLPIVDEPQISEALSLTAIPDSLT